MKNKTWKKLECSAAKTQKKKYSCFNYKELLELRKFWNQRHPDLKIKSKNGRMIWESLKKYMSGCCYTERCWLQQKFMKNKLGKELLKHTFLVSAPETWKKNPREWLNSLDLENIMRQYENHNKEFLSEVILNDKVIGIGKGKSKKSAQQHAAKQALSTVS